MSERTPDEFVDALIAGESLPPDAVPTGEGAERAGDLLFVHGLLGRLGESEAGRADGSIERALDRINEAQQPIRFAWRRLIPMAAAAVVLFAIFGVWWTSSSEHRAVADVRACHAKHGMRRYDLVVMRDDAALPEVNGTVDVDGEGRMALHVTLPEGAPQAQLLLGHTSEGWWIVEPDGSIAHSADKSVVLNWVHKFAGDAPVPSVDATLARLDTDYTVTWSIDQQDPTSVIFSATRRTSDRSEAEFVQIRYARATSRLREILWEWRPPAGSIAKVRQVRATLIEDSHPTKESFLPPRAAPEGNETTP